MIAFVPLSGKKYPILGALAHGLIYFTVISDIQVFETGKFSKNESSLKRLFSAALSVVVFCLQQRALAVSN